VKENAVKKRTAKIDRVNVPYFFLPGASMGLGSLSLGNFSLDPNNLKLDKRLLAKIKNLVPGKHFKSKLNRFVKKIGYF
jgi:hypothetical protein